MISAALVLIVLVGLTTASLLVCLAKWSVLQAWEVKRPYWLLRRCDFCALYWLLVLLLLVAGTCGPRATVVLASRRLASRAANGGGVPGGSEAISIVN